MPLIEWSDNYSVGVEDIDHEHKGLIDLINQLYTNLEQGTSADEIAEFFGEIYANISAHFALEEKFMRESKYPEYVAHKNEHEQLLEDIRDLMDEYEHRSAIDEQELSTRLQTWFSDHFRNMDSRLHKALDVSRDL